MIFDTHTHYDYAAFDEDRAALLSSLKEAGVGHIINVSADPESIETTSEIAETVPFAYGALGIHPDNVGWFHEENLAYLDAALNRPRIVAVGEIGLDYHWNVEDKETQKKWFRAQLSLARKRKLPVIIHSRDAAADTMEIVKDEEVGKIGGVMHCYSYSPEQAREYVAMGLSLGIGGVVTFKNAQKIVQVVEETPLTSILLETDCPYLAPTPHRGSRNSSAYLPYVVAKIAEIKGITEEEVIRVTQENAFRVFRIEDAKR